MPLRTAGTSVKSEATCYLCGHGSFRLRHRGTRDKPALNVIECASCGLVTLDSHSHIDPTHYERSGMHDDTPLPIHEWLRITEADDARRVRAHADSMRRRRVLDLGAGACGFVRMVQDQGIAAAVAGVEPERRVRAHWGSRLELYDSLEAAPGAYDVITAFHVFEHLPDPRAMLASIRERLVPGGFAIIEVPSASDALLTLYRSSAFQSFTYWSQHLFLFTAPTLRDLAHQAGFRRVRVEQLQRYPLANHLHWLLKRKPGGHHRWSALDTPLLNAPYARALSALGRCDTLTAYAQSD